MYLKSQPHIIEWSFSRPFAFRQSTNCTINHRGIIFVRGEGNTHPQHAGLLFACQVTHFSVVCQVDTMAFTRPSKSFIVFGQSVLVKYLTYYGDKLLHVKRGTYIIPYVKEKS